ncbi:MAG: class I SAM-dependent methyltransferase [Oscillospiraceae bacterium]|jgi:SAM-dependent methyltransferase|nr:class I SAM-dependent methyltransferase [Oscillospiraceae bacterium]
MSQNIFDNEAFFENYKSIRNKPESYNNLIEQPAMKSLLPDLNGKIILDMGCGFGCNCMEFIQMGAVKVIGIDISQNMINAAKNMNDNKNIEYKKLNMEHINELNLQFDFIYSSLAMHYIADFASLLKKIFDILNDDGILLFSQEHPLVTAPLKGPSWNTDEHGKKVSSPVSDYLENGERNVKWLSETRQYYHRSFSAIINALTENKFTILQITEPAPMPEILNAAPQMYDEIHRPTAIIIKAQKLLKE